MKRKIFAISFCIMLLSTAIICVALKQPLIFSPVDYSVASFIDLAILSAVLCFLLVFVNLPFLTFLRSIIRSGRDEAFYFIGTFIILQIVTMLLGYAESSFEFIKGPDLFYYYKGAGNSYVYLFTGNFTAIIIASLYTKELSRKRKQEVETKLEL